MDDFMSRLERQLRPAIREVIEHPFLRRIAEASLTRSEVTVQDPVAAPG